MGLIYKPITLFGTENTIRIEEALFDTGSYANIIGSLLPDGTATLRVGFLEAITEIEEYETIGGSRVKGEIVIFPKLEIDQKAVRNVQFTVLPGWDEVIIGYPTMQEIGIKIDMGTDRAFI